MCPRTGPGEPEGVSADTQAECTTQPKKGAGLYGGEGGQGGVTRACAEAGWGKDNRSGAGAEADTGRWILP